jgi:hypothetical protein
MVEAEEKMRDEDQTVPRRALERASAGLEAGFGAVLDGNMSWAGERDRNVAVNSTLRAVPRRLGSFVLQRSALFPGLALVRYRARAPSPVPAGLNSGRSIILLQPAWGANPPG